MTQQRTVIFAVVLAAAVGAAAAGVTAERGETQRGRPVVAQEVGPGMGPDRQVIRLDGRGSQIGVMVSDLDQKEPSGVRVDDVDREGPAERAGLKDGDVVVEFDGERVRSARQFTRLVQETPSGRGVKVTVLRGGARETLDITPESAPAAWSMAFAEPGLRAELDRSLRGLGDLPQLAEPMFNFRYDGAGPAMGRGRLGVQVEPLSDQLAGFFGVTGGGVLVSSVTEDSPAEKAGLKAGDVITSVNGTPVRDAGDLVDQLRGAGSGGEVSLGVVRDKKATTIMATIEQPRATRPARSSRPA
jgi:serine protease Do